MIQNYVKVARRNLIRNKLYSVISVFGLGVGIACCLLIFLYVQDELSFDRFHTKSDDIYRLIREEKRSGEETVRSPSVTYNIAPELKANFPEIERTVRLTGGEYIVSRDGQAFTQGALHVDHGFFDMFSFPLVRGDLRSALESPVSAVITPETAARYFGEDDPLGKTLTINLGETSLDFTVTGIIQKPPQNSSIKFDLLLPVDPLKYNFPEDLLHSWNIVVMQTFIELAPGTDAKALEQKLPALTTRLFAKEERGFQRSYQLQALTDIHLNNKLDGITESTSNPLYSQILTAIAFAVLLLACINFTTLAVGRSSSRAREVGLRKVLGAGRTQLMRQFWGEALLLSLAALVLGVVLAELFLPTFNSLAQKQLSLNLFSDWTLLPTLVGLVLITAFIAGMYPALLLSRLHPVDSLRGNVRPGGRNRLIQGLVIIQFTISVALVVCTLVISSQMRYVNSHNLGYDRNLVLTFPTGAYGETAADLVSRFRQELSGQPAVVSVTGYSSGFGDSWLRVSYGDDGMNLNIGEDITSPGPSEGPGLAANYFYINWVDPYYLSTMGITVSQGRDFSTDIPSDTEGAILVNQTAVKAFGWDDPIGKQLPAGFQQSRVVGVVEDFHFYPLHRRIEPLVFHMPRNDHLSSIYEIAVRIRGDDIPTTLSFLEQTWRRVSEGMPFDYNFLDQRVAEQYAAEQRWMNIVQYSSMFSLLIACLGLFGLTSLAVAKRTKEVGIRKVLGATVIRILSMFASNFFKLVLVANAIAWPVAYVIMDHWLQSYTYRASITLTTFILTAILSLGIALLTVSIQAIKVALTNPVESLRYE
jgi:putative ABC transport system permease protein